MILKEASNVLMSTDPERNEKKNLLYAKFKNGPTNSFLSPFWENLIYTPHQTFLSPRRFLINRSQLLDSLNPYWLLGFWEAVGSFYIVDKGNGRLVHGLGLSLKKDFHI